MSTPRAGAAPARFWHGRRTRSAKAKRWSPRIDGLARLLTDLPEVIERLEARGAFFRSIEDPIDMASSREGHAPDAGFRGRCKRAG